VHGIYAGSSSFEYHKLEPLLAREHRVVTFELLGCGRSAHPNIEYTPELFVEQVLAAVERFGPFDAIVASSLGAAFTVLAASRRPSSFPRLGLICPAGFAGTLDAPPTGAQRPLTALVRSPLSGPPLYGLLVSRPSLRWFLQNQAYADPAAVTAEIVDQYWQIAHQPGARYVPAYFVGGRLNCDIAPALRTLKMPISLLWGARSVMAAPVENANTFLELAPQTQFARFERSSLLPHDEEADAVSRLLTAFVREPL
jgi:pimeloyl-ACP methyl ester carboxylesterase